MSTMSSPCGGRTGIANTRNDGPVPTDSSPSPALHWLSEEPARFDDAPGRVASGDATAYTSTWMKERRWWWRAFASSGRYDFGAVDERGMAALDGTTLIEVCRRDGQFMICPRDPDHPNRTGYAGTPTYPASAAWVAEGTFVAYDEPGPVTVGASVDGLTHVFTSSGEIEFDDWTRQAPTGRLRRRGLRRTVLHLHRPDVRSHDLSGVPVPHRRRTARGRPGHHGLQPRDQSGVRLHRLRDLPAAAPG